MITSVAQAVQPDWVGMISSLPGLPLVELERHLMSLSKKQLENKQQQKSKVRIKSIYLDYSGPFIYFPHSFFDHPKFKALSKAAKLAYWSLLRHYNPAITEEIICTGEQSLLSKNAWTSACRELEKAGFIEILETGGLYRNPNIYKLNNDWRSKKNKIHGKY